MKENETAMLCTKSCHFQKKVLKEKKTIFKCIDNLGKITPKRMPERAIRSDDARKKESTEAERASY